YTTLFRSRGCSSASARARSRCCSRRCSWRPPWSCCSSDRHDRKPTSGRRWADSGDRRDRKPASGRRRAADSVIGAILIGLAGGVIAGLLGVGGGVLFVPGLVLFMKLGQHQAEATSLLAIVPVAIVGTIRQDDYGNVRRGDAIVMGLLSIVGAAAGVALANALSGTVLRVGFALLMVLVAV